jgi:hypothetical protein
VFVRHFCAVRSFRIAPALDGYSHLRPSIARDALVNVPWLSARSSRPAARSAAGISTILFRRSIDEMKAALRRPVRVYGWSNRIRRKMSKYDENRRRPAGGHREAP